jgi:hypothetical protein
LFAPCRCSRWGRVLAPAPPHIRLLNVSPASLPSLDVACPLWKGWSEPLWLANSVSVRFWSRALKAALPFPAKGTPLFSGATAHTSLYHWVPSSVRAGLLSLHRSSPPISCFHSSSWRGIESESGISSPRLIFVLARTLTPLVQCEGAGKRWGAAARHKETGSPANRHRGESNP